MADNWFREIELQKVFSLSPREAYCHARAEDGLTTREIAALAGNSPETVHTLMQRGAAKMKKDSKKVDLIVLKGDGDVEGTAIKQHAIEVVLDFVSMALDLPVYNLKHVFVIKGLDASKPGDALWLKDHVFRKVDILGTMDAAASKMRAEKLISVYNTANDGMEKAGLAILRYYLEQMYMQYDIVE